MPTLYSKYFCLITLLATTAWCWINVTSDYPPQNAIQLIPKKLHTIWFNFGRGDEPFPEYKENVDKLLRLHPGWDYKNWNEAEVDYLIRTEYPQYYKTFSSYDVKIKKHDFCRAVILHKFGGVYVDHDSNTLRNIEPILKSYEIVFGNEMQGRFYPMNGVMASVPRHPFWIYYLDSMSYPGESLKNVLDATGPWKLNPVLRGYTDKFGSKGMKLYDNQFFCPIHCHDRSTGKGMNDDQLRALLPNCYILQQFRSTWK